MVPRQSAEGKKVELEPGCGFQGLCFPSEDFLKGNSNFSFTTVDGPEQPRIVNEIVMYDIYCMKEGCGANYIKEEVSEKARASAVCMGKKA